MEFWYGVAMTLLMETTALLFTKGWLRRKING